MNFTQFYDLNSYVLLGNLVDALVDVGGEAFANLILLVENEVLDLLGEARHRVLYSVKILNLHPL